MTRALRIHAGPIARRHLESHGLAPADIGVVPAAAGGPKGLVLGPLDRFLFGEWLPGSDQPIDLVGASIGACRMANACMPDAIDSMRRFERDYIAQVHPTSDGGGGRPTSRLLTASFDRNLASFYGPARADILAHPRFRLHVVTSRGRHLLARHGRWRTPAGYLGAFAANTVRRRLLGGFMERVVFSTGLPKDGRGAEAATAPPPFAVDDFPTRQVALTPDNLLPVLRATCAVPLLIDPAQDIAGAPPGAYWDGGITDYHLHLRYRAAREPGLVLYPHFQRQVVPGWLDKGLRWRHGPTAALDRMVVLSPDPAWIDTLPNRKLPDRKDFTAYALDPAGRSKVWTVAVAESARLAEEFAAWLRDPGDVRSL